ncbi:cysteine/serine-rich nuclear protein 1-like [Xyrichtys novacula]|uniref:Cysteine/serine-rich nuclear protein 1-like n=1 Tax=Xyrichtys novacula TaxID=13765 RepID=A0AAV1GEV8_XYRNO|nr:cysteine/serine-rich nuclear protein 1-like [Xyrichtys novacula]
MFLSHHSQTMRGILKRKFTEVDDNPCDYYSSSSPASSEWESDGESSPSENNHDVTPYSPSSPSSVHLRSILKRPRLSGSQSNVRFDQVTVFSFPRCQGCTSVPSRGGATLGMVQRHSSLQRYTVSEHALEQQRRHRERLREKLREERFEALKLKLISSGAIDQTEAERLSIDQIQGVDSEIHISDAEVEEGSFLQPFSSRQRQALLLAAGVKRIDREEKRQLQALRSSREACGCDCQGFCEPETCACSLAGIKCQVDRFNFPCGCSKDGCGNTQGRIEFNSRRVQTHYIHTAMRLQLERRLQNETLSQEDQTGLQEDLEEHVDQDESHREQNEQEKSCPFGFSMEEEGISLPMPTSVSFHFSPERLVEENSCSSDMTESSLSSSDSDTGGVLNGSQSLPEVDEAMSHSLDICDSDNKYYSTCNQKRETGEPLTQYSTDSAPYCTQTDSKGPQTDNTLRNNTNRTLLTDYLDENANQSRDFFDDDSLEGYPRTPSPTVNYSSSLYMDLSLSSDSDLEFFDSDYTSGPLHSSFKAHRHTDSFYHPQLFSSVSLPQYESSTYLLESLIGLTEPSTEQVPETQCL